MQKLSERNTYTPTDAPQVRSNCDSVIKQSCEVGTVLQNLKTPDNNPDEALTPRAQGEQDLRVPVIYVLNMRGEPLMPVGARKARILLKKGKAYVVKRTPFTIQLNKATGETKQRVILGVDPGYKSVGLSAVTEKKEVFSAEAQLRTDIPNLNSEKRMYRKSRRSRKTWYRKPRFLNRKIEKGWLAPSVQHKLGSHVKLIQKITKFLPITGINIEVANFDIQKIKNPDISGKEHQEGEQLGFYNVREYVLYRDSHVCQHCKGKSQDKILQVHHIIPRSQGGTDMPENLLTLCLVCHSKHHGGEIKLKVKRSKQFKSETFMSIVRWKIVEEVKNLGLSVNITYGYITKSKRIRLNLAKSHINDAFMISAGIGQKRSQSYLLKQVRKQNRKLFKGIRSHIKNTASRFVKGFQRFDKILFNDMECFIFGRRITGYFDIRTLDGIKISASASYKKLQLLENFQTLLWQGGVVSSHD